MAGAGYKLFVNGNTLSASDLNTYLNQQTVMVFASAAARTAALSGVLSEGMVSYRTDSHITEYYSGSAWTAIAPTVPLTTKGDLYTYDTAGNRLAVGTDGQTLVANSSAATGLSWQNTYNAFNAQTSTTYTLVASDAAKKLVTMSNASAVTLTVPPSIFLSGQTIDVQSIGAGLTTFAQGAGVTITSTGASSSAPKLRAQYSAATIICTTSNVFTIVGDLS